MFPIQYKNFLFNENWNVEMDFFKAIRQYVLLLVSHLNQEKSSYYRFSFSDTFLSYHRAKYFELLSFQLINKNDYSTQAGHQRNAVWFFLHSALKGYSESQYKLGICYLHGELGLKKNIFIAYKWLKLAADQGHIGAINELKLFNRTKQL